MSRERARHECEALVAALDIPEPFDLAAMCQRLGAQRGRPILLMPTTMALGSLCGLWMGTATADYVFYEQDTSRLHQRHIVFHELGHILRGHTATRVLGADVVRAAAPVVRADDVQRVLGRDCYNDDDEFEAELVATLLLRRIGRAPRLDEPRAATSAGRDVVARITDSLSRGDA